ncbi:hypothetical protein B0H13DRAFT_2314350 [Mycena leptocephala]|nr:hypothetical protein B0H13DRAFT_2314350 [Mycena leptocephala]
MSWAITAKKPRRNAGQRSSSPPLCHRHPRLTSALLPCPSFALGFLELCALLSLVSMTLAVCWPGVTSVKLAFLGARGGIDSLELSALIVGLRVLSGCSLSFWCVLVSVIDATATATVKAKTGERESVVLTKPEPVFVFVFKKSEISPGTDTLYLMRRTAGGLLKLAQDPQSSCY